MKDKLDAARAATHNVVDQMMFARDRLDSAMVNGHSIIADPSELRSRLMAARSALDSALTSLDRTDWPSREDYDALEG